MIEFHPLMVPLLAITVVASAVICVVLWRRAGTSSITAGVIGAVCGAVGPLLVMKPIRSCAFEPDRAGIDIALGIVLFATGAALAVGLATWFTFSFARARGRMEGKSDIFDKGAFRRQRFSPLLFLTPTLIILVLFLYRPMLSTFRLSTLFYRTGAPRTPFVCLDNYTKLIEPTIEWWAIAPVVGWAVLSAIRLAKPEVDESALYFRVRQLLAFAAVIGALTSLFSDDYRGVFVTTTIFTVGIVSLSLLIGLVLAVLVSQKIRGRGIYRTLLIWPYAISPPIAGILFYVMFDPLVGIVGNLFEMITPWDAPNYRTNTTLARAVVILASVWKTIGYTMLFYIAGLQNVGRDTLEAAAIDGASALQRFRFVTVPSLAPITFFLVVSVVTYAFFENFGSIIQLTGGGPSEKTVDSLFAVWRSASVQGNFGDGAARSVLLFLLVLGVTAWQFSANRKRGTYLR